jgi:NAD(P)-dependent dehydrogenase (short-subunit alcohol dehydrogenase family)
MRTAIVTGASRGLGLALAKALAERGWRLVIDARGAAALEAAREELVAAARDAARETATAAARDVVREAAAAAAPVIAVPGDIADEAHRRELVLAAGTSIELLVNNASLLGPSPLPPVADLAPSDLEAILRANVIGPLGLLQLALPHMPDGGRIVNVTSDAAVEPYEGWGGYGASKAALEQLTRILAAERPDLRVYAVDPGDMRTRMHQDAFPGEDISDRSPPEDSVPGLLALIEGELPSGRYAARELSPSHA